MAKIEYNLPHGLKFLLEKNTFENCSKTDALRYLKGIHTNKERFLSRFLYKIEKSEKLKPLYDDFFKEYEKVNPFTYLEAFKIKNQEFQSLVFGSINITDMIENLGAKRLCVEGKLVKRKTYFKNGDFDKIVENNVIYETHEVNGEKLKLNRNLYVVKCWCTTTNKEHWLWINENYKDNPLEAIASTAIFHENVIPFITEIKRQGDVFLVELSQELEPKGSKRALTSEEYFRLLTAES